MSSTQARSCLRRDYPSVRGHGDCILLYQKWSHVSQVGVGEIPFHHHVMSDDIEDIQDPRYHMSRRTFFLTCTWVCMGLDGSTCSECLHVVTCDFEPPEQVPRTSVRAHTCAVVFGRAPCVPRSREHQQRPAAGCAKKTTHVHRN